MRVSVAGSAAGSAALDVEAGPDPYRRRLDRRGQQVRRGRGRPRAGVDPQTVERLAAILCTVQEIAAVCGCSRDTLKGNATMLIWLGKQYLGQREPRSDEDAPQDFSSTPLARYLAARANGGAAS